MSQPVVVPADNQTAAPESAEAFACRVAGWWFEAQLARRRGRDARARRFLRWVLIAWPEDEEAWLQLAALAARPEDELAYLRQAGRFHPGSARVLAALRRAWARNLEGASGPLAGDRRVTRCLPHRVSGGNGHRPPGRLLALLRGRV